MKSRKRLGLSEINESDTCRECGDMVPGAGNLCLCDNCLYELECLFSCHSCKKSWEGSLFHSICSCGKMSEIDSLVDYRK